MRFILFTLIIVLFSFSLIAQGVDYSGYNSLLHKYVKKKTVDYQGLKSEKDYLLKFTGLLENKSPDSHPGEFPTDSDKLAYWLNTYNAFILKLIVENYPVESIKDINFIGFTVWLNKNLVDDANQTIYMSSIFDWYDDDFLTWLENNKGIEEPALLDYIAIYLNDGIRDEWRHYDLEFLNYDWSLNNIDR